MDFSLNNIHVKLPCGSTFSVAEITGHDHVTHEVAVLASNGGFVPVNEWRDDKRDDGSDVLMITGTAEALANELTKALLWSKKAVAA